MFYQRWFPKRWLYMKKVHADLFTLAEDNGKLVGCLGFKHRTGELDVWKYLHVVVHQDWRGKNLANDLLHVGIKHLIEAEADYIENDKRVDSIFGLQTWRNMGFRVVHRFTAPLERSISDKPEQYFIFGCKVKKLNYKYLNKYWEKIL